MVIGFSGIIGLGMATNTAGASFVPQLALDLQGGTSIILSPSIADGETVTAEQLAQAVSIIRARVDSTGVSESTVTTSGNNNIVVEIPGTPSDSTLKLIKSSAKLEFRSVLLTSAGVSTSVGETTDASASPKPSASASAAVTPNVAPTDASDLNWITPDIQAKFDALDCSTQFRTPGQVDDPKVPLATCDFYGQKYVLGPVEIDGANIADASAGTVTTSTGASTNEWAVNLEFDAEGTETFSATTSRLFPLTSPRNQFAVTLDGFVITAPQAKAVISNGSAQITGSFDKESSTSLADQLKYGSLPIGFEVQSQENISATLGSESLRSGLLAGLIGLILVVIYSAFQYRALAIVTVGSLVVAAVITYLLIAILSWRQGYRLSLSGVAGLIVAIGITADSFIVYFERVRDELRDGRTLSAAVESGWKRAVRTILVSDGVSMLAAVVLFTLTVGSVKGFAFTLGLTTLVDLAVVALFTHPMLQVLAQRKFFRSGNKWSGFDAKALGGHIYVGRGKFAVAETVSDAKRGKASKEAEKRQTIAERKAASNQNNGGQN
ncbi:MAG: protein translocase subunit SecD [Rhodoluna sp.]|nr:protein translocase subunit SecD [Rhodoluna sp.]MBP6186864.1 protein translocase subunit SecD [Rhodoluna sp.]